MNLSVFSGHLVSTVLAFLRSYLHHPSIYSNPPIIDPYLSLLIEHGRVEFENDGWEDEREKNDWLQLLKIISYCFVMGVFFTSFAPTRLILFASPDSRWVIRDPKRYTMKKQPNIFFWISFFKFLVSIFSSFELDGLFTFSLFYNFSTSRTNRFS